MALFHWIVWFVQLTFGGFKLTSTCTYLFFYGSKWDRTITDWSKKILTTSVIVVYLCAPPSKPSNVIICALLDKFPNSLLAVKNIYMTRIKTPFHWWLNTIPTPVLCICLYRFYPIIPSILNCNGKANRAKVKLAYPSGTEPRRTTQWKSVNRHVRTYRALAKMGYGAAVACFSVCLCSWILTGSIYIYALGRLL